MQTVLNWNTAQFNMQLFTSHNTNIEIGRALLICLSLVTPLACGAQTYSDNDLLLINAHKNAPLSAFLNKQAFPSITSSESASEFAEQHGLVRDRRLYGSESNKCRGLDFYSVDVGNDYNPPVVNKTISLPSRESGSTKAEYQAEWDKIFRKLGKPSYLEVSREVWPSNTVGMIDYATYKLNHNGRLLYVTLRLTMTGCLTATTTYSLDSNVSRLIREARDKAAPKSSAADAL